MIESGIAEDGPDNSRIADIQSARKRQEAAFIRSSAAECERARVEPPGGATEAAPHRTASEPSVAVRSPRAFAPAPVAIPLPAAMGYCARHTLDALNGRGDESGHAALRALSASTRELLAWWFGDDACRKRRRNFHVGQREAILHTVLARELFRSDDPRLLFRDACGLWPAASDPASLAPGFASYRLRMAPGSGVRWVVQALWLWQWAGDAEQRALVHRDAHFDPRATVLTGDRDTAERFADAIFGPRDERGVRAPGRGRFAVGFDVFAPPRLRGPLLRWLSSCAEDEARSPLRIATLDERDAARQRRTMAPLRLAIGDGAHHCARDGATSTPFIALPAAARDGDTATRALSRDIRDGIAADFAHDAARDEPARMLWLEFDDGTDDPPADAAVLTDLPLARAMRVGASKSVLLADTGDRTPEKGRTVETRYRRGRRPVLPRRHRPPLDAGLRVLERFDRQTAALRAIDGNDAPPALLVLCEDSHWYRAVLAYARARGVGDAWICGGGDLERQLRARVLVDALPPERAAMQPRFCAVVVLRESGAEVFDGLDAGRLLAPALAPRWRGGAFAEIGAENRERIADGRAPGNLIDALPAIAAHWPVRADRGVPNGFALPRVSIADIPDPAGDMRVVGLRGAYRDFDFAMPDPAAAACGRPSRLLSMDAQRTMRASYSMPVRKCIYTHQGWSKRSDGMERGLIEMAEDDPHIAAFCLFDATRYPWPGSGAAQTIESGSADAPPACPHALVRTAGYVYVVQFAPALPVRSGTETEPPGVRAARDAMAAWCRRVNALPGDRRQYREWRPVQVQAPLFWSWKRRGGALSSLLSALAETTPITAQRPRLAQPFDGS